MHAQNSQVCYLKAIWTTDLIAIIAMGAVSAITNAVLKTSSSQYVRSMADSSTLAKRLRNKGRQNDRVQIVRNNCSKVYGLINQYTWK